jgi:phospholipase C
MPEQGAVNLYEVDGPQVKLKKSVPVGKAPGRMCLAPDGRRLFVLTATGATAIDLTTETVATTFADPAVKSPHGCIVSYDARKLYLADRGASAVLVFSVDSGRLLKKIDVPADVRYGVYTLGNKWLVFSCGDGKALAVVDPATDTVTRTVKTVSLDPRSMVITPDRKYLVVALVSADLMTFYDAGTLEPVNSFGVTRSPQDMVVAPDGERIYVAGYYEGVIGVIDLREHNAEGVGEWRQSSAIPVGPAASIAISSDGNYLYASPTDGTGTIVDLRSWKIIKPPALKGAGRLLYVK